MGRIEHSLLVGERTRSTDLRPSPANQTIPRERNKYIFSATPFGPFLCARTNLFGERLLVQNAYLADSGRKNFWCRMPTFCADGSFGARPPEHISPGQDFWCRTLTFGAGETFRARPPNIRSAPEVPTISRVSHHSLTKA